MKKGLFKNPLRRWGWLFLGPVAAAFVIGFVWPFIQGIYLSFCKFRTTSDAKLLPTIGESLFGNYQKAIADPSFIHSELGWLPETRFVDGIQKTIQWYLDNREWWENIVSGEYQDYYERMYGNR